VPVAIGAKPLNILSTLVAANGNLVTKDELIEGTWPGLIVEENTLQAHISSIRRILGESGRWIVTVPGQGYRFAGPLSLSPSETIVVELPAPVGQPPSAPVDSPMTQSAQSAVATGRRKPRIRPQLWIAALGVLAALGVAAVWATWPPGSRTRPGAEIPDRFLVLPFVNRSGEASNDNFVDALTDSVTGRLARESWNDQVVGHNKAFAFKGQAINEAKLGEQLDLTWIVEGALLPSANDFEVSATVIDARSGTQVAAVSARAPKDRSKSQLEWLSAELIPQLRLAVVREERRRADAHTPDDTNVKELLVRAGTLLDEQTVDSIRDAESLIEKALALDPHNLHGLCFRGSALLELVTGYYFATPAERTALLDQVEIALGEAARIDPDRGSVHLLLGDLRSAQGRHDAARAEYQRVLDLDPVNSYALDGVAQEAIFTGDPDAAFPMLDEARQLNPDDAYLIDGDVALAELIRGHDDAALAAIRKAETVDSSDPWVWATMAGLLQLNGHADEARAALASLRRINPGITIAKLRLGDAGAAPPYERGVERLYAALKDAGLEE
jgi:DNA-binding winged helix-turn-helix (wHTH) protein/TolB-like protein